MNKVMTSIFGVNWRTSVLSYAGAVFTACLPYLQNHAFNIQKDWKYLVMAAGIALFGGQVKDAKVTGTPEQNKNK